jgi:hypothetical protein
MKNEQETNKLISESRLLKRSGDVEIYEHPVKGKFAVLGEGQVSWDEAPIAEEMDHE